jgi:hypothetical protein
VKGCGAAAVSLRRCTYAVVVVGASNLLRTALLTGIMLFCRLSCCITRRNPRHTFLSHFTLINYMLSLYVGMTMYALPAVNALMQKYSTVDAYLQSFVQHFCQHQLQEYHKQKAQQPGQAAKDAKDTGAGNASAPKSASGDEKFAPKNPECAPTNNPGPNSAAPEATSENPENLEQYVRETEMMAVAIFNKVLTDSVLYYLFVTVKPAREGQQSGAEGSAEGKESSDSKLSVIFQAFLQTAAFSYQQSASEETPDEAEAPTGDAEQDATEEGLNGGLD